MELEFHIESTICTKYESILGYIMKFLKLFKGRRHFEFTFNATKIFIYSLNKALDF